MENNSKKRLKVGVLSFKWLVLMLPLFSFSSCKKTWNINNKYLTASAPRSYADITQHERDDVLFLDNALQNGLESIFSIDNIQDLTIQSNAQTIKDSSPKEVLNNRLRIIAEDTRDPNMGWQNFKIADQPKEFIYKGYKAAEATFTVDENVNKTGRIVKRKLRRIVLFTNNDLWNFVLAPSDIENYEKEMKIFDRILESITIKK